MMLSRPVRRWTLVLHVVVSVGWLGVDLTLLALGTTALVTGDGAVRHSTYVAMDLVGGTLLVPIALLALTTGLVLSLGTKWGLVRHWWVLVKLAITTVAATLTIFLLRPGLDEAARTDLGGLIQERVNLVVAPTVALILYTTATILSVLKPWGRTRWVGRPSAGSQLLRHAQIAVTMEANSQAPSSRTRDALRRLSESLDG